MMELPKAKSFEQLVARYGEPWLDKQGFEQKFMTLWKAEILEERECFDAKCPIRRIYCNRDLVPYLDRAFKNLYDRGLLYEIKTFDGCWEIREIRGRQGAWSIHSFGLAVDFNAKENPLGGPVTFTADTLACFKDAGFTLGADFKRIDGMHVQAADNC